MIPRAAMLLAAGLGTRMRPLTEHTAKPLLPLGGRTLLDHALTRLAAAGVETVVVNAYWHADLVAAHLAARWPGPPNIVLRREEELLDTGGAVRAALGELGPEPFFVVNGDSVWLDGPAAPALARLAAAWDSVALDALLLTHSTFQASGEVGDGDFFLDPLGRIRRRRPREIAPYVYAGVQLLHPRLFADAHEETFSANVLWDRAIAADRVRAVVHDGLWFHLSTPADLATAESIFQAGGVGQTR
jgi:N-acetyl-alpha-D-muramate 1-phosphate uridylyltransferase